MRRWALWLGILSLVGCDEPPPVAPPVAPEPRDAPEPAADLADAPGGMTLRLPEVGASREQVFADQPGCADERAATDDGCRFDGWLHPLSQHCEDGCTWWTYRFEDDALTAAELERGEWDVDAEWAARFTAEAHDVAAELSRRLRAEPTVEWTGMWLDVEADEDGAPRVLERRTWTLPDRRVVWTVSGHPGHHPGIVLRVTETAP